MSDTRDTVVKKFLKDQIKEETFKNITSAEAIPLAKISVIINCLIKFFSEEFNDFVEASEGEGKFKSASSLIFFLHDLLFVSNPKFFGNKERIVTSAQERSLVGFAFLFQDDVLRNKFLRYLREKIQKEEDMDAEFTVTVANSFKHHDGYENHNRFKLNVFKKTETPSPDDKDYIFKFDVTEDDIEKRKTKKREWQKEIDEMNAVEKGEEERKNTGNIGEGVNEPRGKEKESAEDEQDSEEREPMESLYEVGPEKKVLKKKKVAGSAVVPKVKSKELQKVETFIIEDNKIMSSDELNEIYMRDDEITLQEAYDEGYKEKDYIVYQEGIIRTKEGAFLKQIDQNKYAMFMKPLDMKNIDQRKEYFKKLSKISIDQIIGKNVKRERITFDTVMSNLSGIDADQLFNTLCSLAVNAPRGVGVGLETLGGLSIREFIEDRTTITINTEDLMWMCRAVHPYIDNEVLKRKMRKELYPTDLEIEESARRAKEYFKQMRAEGHM